MRSLFAPSINQTLDTLIDSATVTLSGIGVGVPFTLVSGTAAYKNGANVVSTTVSDGDRIRLRVRSATTYATPTFTVAKIGNEEIVFTAVTTVDPAKIVVNNDLLPFDLTQYSDGREYVPSFTGNALSVYTAGSFTKKIALSSPNSNIAKTTDSLVLANFYGDNIYVLNDVLGISASISMGAGSKPYGIATTPVSSSNDILQTWVTLSGLDKVVLLDVNHQQVAEYNTGDRPLGIASSPDYKHVYVANNGSNTVTHFSNTNDVWSSTTVNVGAKPFEVITDKNGDAWITCIGDDKIYKVTTANVVTSYDIGGAGLRGMALDKDGLLWVASAESAKIIQLNLTGAVAKTYTTALYPYALAVDTDGLIATASFVDSKLYYYSPVDGSTVRTLETSAYPYGVASFNNQLVVANLYENTPEFVTVKDQTSTPFGLADPLNVKPNTLITSNTFTVSGLNTATPASVPPDVLGAKIVKNGNVGTNSTTVVNGDTIAIQYTSPNTYDTAIDIPLYIGNVYDSILTRTEAADVTPNAVTFNDTLLAELNTAYTSNEVTIAGLTEGRTVPFTVDAGKIVLNGVEQGSLTVQVKNGDKIALRITSANAEKSSVYVNATYGAVVTNGDGSTTRTLKATWRLATKAVEEHDPPLTPLVLAFEPIYDALLNEVVTSKTVVVKNLVAPAIVSSQLSADYTIFVNDEAITTVEFELDNEDEVYIVATASSAYYDARTITISDYMSSNSFIVRTESDSKPDLVSFADLFDAIPRQIGESNTATISGITDGHTVSLHVNRTGWGVSVNGAAPQANAQVKNGDVIKLVGPIRGPYASQSTFILQAGRSNEQVGTFTVHTRVLDGASVFIKRRYESPAPVWGLKVRNEGMNDSTTLSAEGSRRSVQYSTAMLSFDRSISHDLFEADMPEVELKADRELLTIERFEFEAMHGKTLHEFDRGEFIALHGNTMRTAERPQFESMHGKTLIEADFILYDRNTSVTSQKEISDEDLGRSAVLKPSSNQMTVERVYELRVVRERLEVDTQYGFAPRRLQNEVNIVEFTILPISGQKLAPEVLFQDNAKRPMRSFAKVEGMIPSLVQHDLYFAELPSFELRRRYNSMHLSDMPQAIRSAPSTHRELSQAPEPIAMSRRAMLVPVMGTFEKLSQAVNEVEMPTAIAMTSSMMEIALPEAMTSYVIHNYTKEETTAERGGFASAAEAIAAGKAAGYPEAFAVRVQSDCFVWATPIEEGDFCGVKPPPTSTIPRPVARYLQGG